MFRKRSYSPFIEEFQEPTVNLTPLIDVVFVILITFLVISPFLEIDQIQLAEKKHQEESIKIEQNAIGKITLKNSNEILWNSQPVNTRELRLFLFQAHEKNPLLIPQLFPDKAASFGAYQEIKNIVEEVGFEKMDIILKSS